MPQMAPIMWISVFFFLFISIIVVLNLMYFLKSKKQFKILPQSMELKASRSKNWLW